jgi:hypothetical protein
VKNSITLCVLEEVGGHYYAYRHPRVLAKILEHMRYAEGLQLDKLARGFTLPWQQQ